MKPIQTNNSRGPISIVVSNILLQCFYHSDWCHGWVDLCFALSHRDCFVNQGIRNGSVRFQCQNILGQGNAKFLSHFLDFVLAGSNFSSWLGLALRDRSNFWCWSNYYWGWLLSKYRYWNWSSDDWGSNMGDWWCRGWCRCWGGLLVKNFIHNALHVWWWCYSSRWAVHFSSWGNI